MKKNIALVLVFLLSIAFMACGAPTEKGAKDSIVIGGKAFTEQDILVYLVGELIEKNTDLSVEKKGYLGGTNILAESIESGDLDIYIEYTGTALMSVLKEDVNTDSKEVLELITKRYAEEKNLSILSPLGFNNTYAITIRKEMAEELGIKTITDLADHSQNLVFAGTQEFMERKDGYEPFIKVYNMNFSDPKGMDPGLSYTALKEGQIDVGTAFATDGRIPAFDLLVLEDDKHFFPPYDAVPVVRNDLIEAHPEVKELLESLAGELTDEVMASLNSKVDIDKMDSEEVAHQWLLENGFVTE